MLDRIQKITKNRIVMALIVGAICGGSWYFGCFEEGVKLVDEHAVEQPESNGEALDAGQVD